MRPIIESILWRVIKSFYELGCRLPILWDRWWTILLLPAVWFITARIIRFELLLAIPWIIFYSLQFSAILLLGVRERDLIFSPMQVSNDSFIKRLLIVYFISLPQALAHTARYAILFNLCNRGARTNLNLTAAIAAALTILIKFPLVYSVGYGYLALLVSTRFLVMLSDMVYVVGPGRKRVLYEHIILNCFIRLPRSVENAHSMRIYVRGGRFSF